MTDLIASDKRNSPNGRPSWHQAWPMYRALVGLGGLCGLLLALAYTVTRPTIEQKQAQHLQAAILKVIPGAVSQKAWLWREEKGFQLTELNRGDAIIYAGYDQQGNWLGSAIMASGMGYQDTLRLLFGYQPQQQLIVGMQVLASKETPGLGDKIESAPHFLANFKELEARVRASGEGLRNTIVAVKQGQKHQPWQIDGITGATISSKAVATIINDSAQFWLPRIQAHQSDFLLSDGEAPKRE